MPWNHPIKEGIDQNTPNREANTAVSILNSQPLGDEISPVLCIRFVTPVGTAKGILLEKINMNFPGA